MTRTLSGVNLAVNRWLEGVSSVRLLTPGKKKGHNAGMPKKLSPDQVPDLLQPGQRIYVQGFTGEPTALLDALESAPEKCKDVRFYGVWIPGVNTRDFTALHPTVKVELYFMCPQFSGGWERGQIEYVHLHYTDVYRRIAYGPPADLALVHVSPPDENGECSSGVSSDFAPAIFGNAKQIVAEVNPNMPRTIGAATIPYTDLDFVVETEHELVPYDAGEPTPDMIQIAKTVSSVIRDGDTLQFGIGKLPTAILGLLADKREVRIHSGMVTDPVLRLLDAGAIPDLPGAIRTGAAAGSPPLYDRIKTDSRFEFVDVRLTHGIAATSRIDNLVAINSALEVDLTGQANAEMTAGRQISGTGGLVDFLRGAHASAGGRPIIALGATARGGTISRIVPHIAPENTITVSRADVGLVVTEHGVADLRDKSLGERADLLISIADPAFRDDLRRGLRS